MPSLDDTLLRQRKKYTKFRRLRRAVLRCGSSRLRRLTAANGTRLVSCASGLLARSDACAPYCGAINAAALNFDGSGSGPIPDRPLEAKRRPEGDPHVGRIGSDTHVNRRRPSHILRGAKAHAQLQRTDLQFG